MLARAHTFTIEGLQTRHVNDEGDFESEDVVLAADASRPIPEDRNRPYGAGRVGRRVSGCTRAL
jgi:hypothetical protein